MSTVKAMTSFRHGPIPWPILAIGLLVIVIQITWKPFIMSDEVTYSIAANHFPWWEAQHGQYLFSIIQSLSGFFGDSFYVVAKLINLVLWAASALPVFWISLRFVDRTVAILISLAYLIMPASFYASSFMPEALLAFCVLVSLYLSLRISESEPSIILFLLLVFSLLAASSTKAHGAVFTLFSVLSSIIIWALWRERKWLIVSLAASIALLLRMAVGVIAGEQAPFIFGVYNRSVAPPVASVAETGEAPGPANSFWSQLVESTIDHSSLLLVAMPIIVTVVLLGSAFRSPGTFYIIGAFGSMFLLAIYYHASTVVGGEAIDEQNLSRYFEFLIPVAIAPALFAFQKLGRISSTLFTVLLVVFGITILFVRDLPTQTVANSALGGTLSQGGWGVAIFYSLGFVALLVFWRLDLARIQVSFMLAPILLLSTFFLIDGSQTYTKLYYWDFAGKDLQTLSNAYGNIDLLIVTENRFLGYAAGFYSNNPNFRVSPNDWCLRESECSPDFILYMENLGPQTRMTKIIENAEYRIFQPE